MDQERLSHAKDVSNGDTDKGQIKDQNQSRRQRRSPFARLASGIALCGAWVIRLLLYLLYGLLKLILLLGRGLLQLKKPLGRLKQALMQPLRIRMRHADQVQQNMRAARKKGRKHFAAALLESAHA